tara:strand:- start:1116 stop:1667 length:552 start_codon:yes stop_codon:yes gene_type:complete
MSNTQNNLLKINQTKKRNIFISQCIRIIITIFILYALDIPIFIKILLIIINDLLDCLGCDNLYYQKLDKISDSICYILLLFYILQNGNLSTNYNYLITLLLIYRLIGTYLFIIKNNRKYLFYFPNFFLEICLGLMIINYYPVLKEKEFIIIIIIIIYKIITEYFHHYKRIYSKLINNNKKYII